MTLEVRDLVTSFRTPAGLVRAVDGVSFDLEDGRTLCIAGESGCGKSVTALSIMGLLPDSAVVESGAVRFRGRDLLAMPERERMQLRGKAIGMIFQEPMTALNPVLTVGEQVAEVFLIHRSASRVEAHRRALAMLEKVQIPDAQRRYGEYPHQMSGGMKQRVMIAMALACQPKLLLADEPTTALDVTIQAQILELLRELQKQRQMAIMLITHDLGVVAENADVVCVMYAGRVVEYANVFELFENPMHPYTRGLFASIPKVGEIRERLVTIADVIDNEGNFRLLPGAERGVRPWWPWHQPPADLRAKDEPAGDYYLQEVKPDHWVGVWRTEAVRDHASRAPDLAYRIADDPSRSMKTPVSVG